MADALAGQTASLERSAEPGAARMAPSAAHAPAGGGRSSVYSRSPACQPPSGCALACTAAAGALSARAQPSRPAAARPGPTGLWVASARAPSARRPVELGPGAAAVPRSGAGVSWAARVTACALAATQLAPTEALRPVPSSRPSHTPCAVHPRHAMRPSAAGGGPDGPPTPRPRPRSPLTSYRGVTVLPGGRCRVRVYAHGRTYTAGTFADPTDAAMAYDW
jgi:hypothetical protein